MATILLRPISNQVKSWDSSDYSFIDDIVTYPDIDGTADYNEAAKADANETESFNLPALGGIVTDISIYILANSVGETLTMFGNYNIDGTVGAKKTFFVLTTGFAWYTDSWTGLSLNASSVNRILLGFGNARGSSDKLRIAVAYMVLTYTPIDSINIQGGNIRGGNIR